MERENDVVMVRSYDRTGTRVKEHKRRKPTLVKANFKLRMNEDGGVMKGSYVERDKEGRVIEREKINEPFTFTEEEKRQLQRISDEK